MRRRSALFGLLLAVPAVAAPPVAPPPRPVTPPPADARAAVERAIPFVEREGVAWMEMRRCVSCHHTTFMTWSLSAAAGRGIAVDAAKLADWTAWARDFRTVKGVDNPAWKDDDAPVTFRRQPDAVAQLLLGAARPDVKWAAEMRAHLVAGQEANGSWKAGGQLPGQKRPARETDDVTTMWAVLALAPARATDPAVGAAAAKAKTWLKNGPLGESTEWWAVRMLWWHATGEAGSEEPEREFLLGCQQPDGGWGWRTREESDALGTGIALYALLRSGTPRDAPAVRRAVEFLRTTQRADGSWAVKGTKAARRDHIEPTAVYWGTCWAVIALAETLPAPGR